MLIKQTSTSKGKTMFKYTVIAKYNSCDDVVHGTFKSEKSAEKKVIEVRNNFDDYDHRHCEEIVISVHK
jgi:hypothetical protein